MTKNSLHDIVEDADYGITLSDGTRLSARIWKPKNAGEAPVPAILEYLPYRKRDGTCARDALTHPYFAQRGYACIRVDMRGNGDSHGLMTDEYTQQELDDAVEVIHHLAAQDWCDGNIGMMGISWGGFNGLQVAAMTPEPLKAIITLCSTVDRYADDIHYKGGCLLNENLGWGATMWSYSSRAPDPALRPDWRDMWLERLENEPFLPSTWLRHQTRDEYWKHGSVCESYDTIKAKVLAVGGWGDAYKNTVRHIVDNIPGSKGIIGPWVHKYPHFAVPEPRIGFLQEALRWWDKWLKGIDTGADKAPRLRVYQMDGVRPASWYTERAGHWSGYGHEGGDILDVSLPMPFTSEGISTGNGPVDVTLTSPQHCGSDAGEYCAIWLGPELPGDQRRDDALSATWDSAPLDEDRVITGAPSVFLKLTVDKPVAQLAVRLNHVHPDGASTRITYGTWNLTHSMDHADADQLKSGEVMSLTIPLDQIAYTVPKGHRLRVSVSNAYWPLIWPSPEASTIKISAGGLTLPYIAASGGAETVSFAPPEAAAPWETKELRPENHVRRQETDMTTGIVSLVIEDDFGKVRDLEHGLINGSIARERWDIHPDDPLSARGECHWSDEIERDDIRLRTEARCSMWSDATHFYLSAKLEAYENEILIYSRDVSDKIKRNGI